MARHLPPDLTRKHRWLERLFAPIDSMVETIALMSGFGLLIGGRWFAALIVFLGGVIISSLGERAMESERSIYFARKRREVEERMRDPIRGLFGRARDDAPPGDVAIFDLGRPPRVIVMRKDGAPPVFISETRVPAYEAQGYTIDKEQSQ